MALPVGLIVIARVALAGLAAGGIKIAERFWRTGVQVGLFSMIAGAIVITITMAIDPYVTMVWERVAAFWPDLVGDQSFHIAWSIVGITKSWVPWEHLVMCVAALIGFKMALFAVHLIWMVTAMAWAAAGWFVGAGGTTAELEGA